MFETYDEMPIFIYVDIMEDAVESVTQKLLGSFGPGVKELEALQGWILKFGDDRKRHRTSVETIVKCLENKSSHWTTYREVMSGRLIALGKQLGVCLVGVGETWRHLFANIVIRVTVSEATSMCQKEQLCDGLKAVIDNESNRVK